MVVTAGPSGKPGRCRFLRRFRVCCSCTRPSPERPDLQLGSGSSFRSRATRPAPVEQAAQRIANTKPFDETIRSITQPEYLTKPRGMTGRRGDNRTQARWLQGRDGGALDGDVPCQRPGDGPQHVLAEAVVIGATGVRSEGVMGIVTGESPA
jgi:hypothetical protein